MLPNKARRASKYQVVLTGNGEATKMEVFRSLSVKIELSLPSKIAKVYLDTTLVTRYLPSVVCTLQNAKEANAGKVTQ